MCKSLSKIWFGLSPNARGALTLLIGLLIAAVARAVVQRILNRTNIDKVAAGITGRSDGRDLPR